MKKNVFAITIVGMLLLSNLMITSSVIADHGNIIYVDDDNTVGPWNGTQEHPYQHIQDAINSENTSEDDTIFVYNGTYYENVIINKSINLVGEDKGITVVNASGGLYAFNISVDHANISGFTIKNAFSGIKITNSSDNIIANNIIRENLIGLEIDFSSNNIVTVNDIIDNSLVGIALITNSTYNMITKNNIKNNGALFDGYGLIVFDSSDNNTIYHNNFIDNGYSVTDFCNNTYDNDHEGNYWSDFDEPSEGAFDNNTDRIVDKPYNVSGGNSQDLYPLMFQFGEIPPVANFSYKITGLRVEFDASSSYDCDGDIFSYYWEFGDGESSTTTNSLQSHPYDKEYTTYSVNLTVTDDDGNTDTVSMDVTTEGIIEVKLDIVKPVKGLYLFNNKFRLPRYLRPALIIGPITIEVNVTDDGSIVKQVNFYIDPIRKLGKPVGNDTEPDSITGLYTYNWTRSRPRLFFRYHVIRVVAFDYAGNYETDWTIVKKIF